jgi:hypothetical protein
MSILLKNADFIGKLFERYLGDERAMKCAFISFHKIWRIKTDLT